MSRSSLSPGHSRVLPTRISVKFFVDQPELVNQKALIPVFHGWIRHDVLGTLLVDVADYTHVHHGPGVILVAHEGLYSTDESDGRLGLRYEHKRPMAGTLADQIRHVLDKTLAACRALEREQSLEGAIHFRTDEVLLQITDRLNTPNDDETFRRLQHDVASAFGVIYGDALIRMERDTNRSVFTIRMTALEAAPLETLSDRIRNITALAP